MDRSRILSISITFAIVLILVLIPPAAALKIEITEPSPKVLGESISFSIKITIEETELLPIQRVNLQIRNVDNATYSLSCENLPLVEENKTYSTNGGTLIVRAKPEENWQYGYGYGYASWENVGYYWGYGYGYGYGYEGVWGVGPTSITYNVTWSSPSTWPGGNYRISVDITANGTTFSKSRTVALESAPTPSVPTAPVYGVSTSISPSYSVGLVGTRLAYTVTVRNTGNVSDTYSLTVTDTAGWSPSISPTSLSLSAGESGTAALSVTIPEGAESGTEDTITVTATSETDVTASDSSTCVARAEVVLPPPARFELSNLIIRPATVLPGDIVTISVMVTNVGDIRGDYTVILRIDGAIEAAQTVSVDAGASETVIFTVVRTEARSYNVEVNGLFGSFTVSAPPPTAWLVLLLAIIAIIPVVLILLKKLK
ncbi:MAG: FixG Ig-like domain-containing protein [Candidatus Hadarchaeaceae archaeon]